MQATHFRAYAAATATVSTIARDDNGNLLLGDDGLPFKAPIEKWPVEEVAFEGECTDGEAEFDSGDVKITRIVFLKDDVVIAAIDAGGAKGLIAVQPKP